MGRGWGRHILGDGGGRRYRSYTWPPGASRFCTRVPVNEQGPCWTEEGGIGSPFLLILGIRKRE